MALATLEQDLAEAARLVKETGSARLQSLLAKEVSVLNHEIAAEKAKTARQPPATLPTVETGKAKARKEFPSYSWDQTEKTLKIRASYPDGWVCKEGSQDTSQCTDDDIVIHFTTDKGILTLRIEHLQKPVESNKLSFKFKDTYVLVSMPKRTWGTWIELRSKDQATINRKVDENPDKTLLTMMKNLYDEGDDDMKRTIGEAMRESRMHPSA